MTGSLIERPCEGDTVALASRFAKAGMTDTLLQQIATGHSSAVEEFLARYTSSVWGLARRFCRSAEDAEDATQEIFVEVWKNADRFDPATMPGPYFRESDLEQQAKAKGDEDGTSKLHWFANNSRSVLRSHWSK